MTQQPLGSPSAAGQRGAVDLTTAPQPADSTPATSFSGSYAVGVSQETFQSTLEASYAAPVLLVFYSPSRLAESVAMAQDFVTLADEFEGRFLVGLVDVDREPAIAQAVQLPSVPYVFAVVDGRPSPLLADVVPFDELRTVLTQLAQQLTVQGLAGRHQPRVVQAAEGESAVADPRYAAAQDALAEGDVDTAIAEYGKLIDANPADREAAAGLSMAQLLKRTSGVDLNAARAAAAASPDDVAAQIMVADLDLLGGHVEDSFQRLIGLVSRTSGDERNAAREHLIVLFDVVGNDDERVLTGRRALASALF